MRGSAVQLTEKGQRLVSELAGESCKPPAKVIEVAPEFYHRQQATKRARSASRGKVARAQRPSQLFRPSSGFLSLSL